MRRVAGLRSGQAAAAKHFVDALDAREAGAAGGDGKIKPRPPDPAKKGPGAMRPATSYIPAQLKKPGAELSVPGGTLRMLSRNALRRQLVTAQLTPAETGNPNVRISDAVRLARCDTTIATRFQGFGGSISRT